MAKKGRGEILGLILHNLKKQPMTASELAISISSNWDTVKHNLVILEELGLCEGLTEGKKKTVYKIKRPSYEMDERTWFGLPISDKQKQLTEKYLASAKQAWIKWANIEPNKIQIEKTAFELIRNQKEEGIPLGWYLYGPVALLRLEHSNLSGFDDHLVTSAKPIVENQKEFKYSKSLIYYVYQKYKRRTHENKVLFDEKLMRGISNDDEKISVIITLNNILRGFSLDNCIFDKTINSVQELFDGYTSVTSKLLISNNSDIINKELREPIIDSFGKLWTLLARIIFLEDMKPYMASECIKNSLARSFIDAYNDAEMSIDMLFGLIPKKEVQPNLAIAKFSGIAKN